MSNLGSVLAFSSEADIIHIMTHHLLAAGRQAGPALAFSHSPPHHHHHHHHHFISMEVGALLPDGALGNHPQWPIPRAGPGCR